MPPVAATDSLSTDDIAIFNKEWVETTVKGESLPRRNYSYSYSSISRAKGTNDRANIGKYAAQHGLTGLCHGTLVIVLVMPLILSLMVFVRLVLLVPGTIDYLQF